MEAGVEHCINGSRIGRFLAQALRRETGINSLLRSFPTFKDKRKIAKYGRISSYDESEDSVPFEP